MLYKLNLNQGRFDRITPVAFKDFSHFNQFEIDLEKLISENYDVLFEDNRLMLVYRQTPGQGMSDVYALNEKGELFIFELKLRIAGSAAVDQVLRYAQNAGQLKYAKLQENYQRFLRSDNANLLCAHKEAFGLEVPLKENEFNNRQHLIIVGTAADDELIIAVDYWRAQGISINFLPYPFLSWEKNYILSSFLHLTISTSILMTERALYLIPVALGTKTQSGT